MAIELPRYEMLICKHEGKYITTPFSGSCGTLPEKGCLAVETFNYKVYVDLSSENEQDFKLIAQYSLIAPWSEGGKRNDPVKRAFDNSPSGLDMARKWLSDELMRWQSQAKKF